MWIRRPLVAALVLSAASLLPAACASGPSTKEEVCASFDELSKQALQGNGVFGNPLFNKAEDLADVAQRYEGQPDLAGDAAALQDIADADSTTVGDLMNATTTIARLCGHSLGGGF